MKKILILFIILGCVLLSQTTVSADPKLKTGWNFVSLPKNETVYKYDVFVRNDTQNYTFQQAIDNGIILRFLYGWNRTLQSYYDSDYFEPYNGYQFYCYIDDYELWINGTCTGNVTKFNITINNTYNFSYNYGVEKGNFNMVAYAGFTSSIMAIGLFLHRRKNKNI